MLKKLLNITVLSMTLFHVPLYAVEVSKLDEADIIVDSRANTVRSAALKEALASVFLKNSGSPSVVMHPMVKAQINNPEALLIQYGYSQVDSDLLLTASFDHQRVISTLRQADLPVWGGQRPLTLLWVTLVEANDTVILSDSSESPLRADLMAESNNKGIPVLLPLMDLDDLMAVSPTDVKGMFLSPVNVASTRYQADYFAIADISETSSTVTFTLSLFDKTQTGSTLQPLIKQQGEAVDTAAASKRIMALLADYYISQYAIAASGNNLETQVSFTGVTQMKQLVEIEKYLQQLSAVKEIAISQFQNETVTYQLSLFSSIEDLQRLLSIDNRLSKIDTMGNVNTYFETKSSDKSTLTYQWQGQ